MVIGGAFAFAQNGMTQAGQQLHGAAQNIASGQLDPKDMVDVRLAEHSFDASAAVMRTADEMAKSLLDVKV